VVGLPNDCGVFEVIMTANANLLVYRSSLHSDLVVPWKRGLMNTVVLCDINYNFSTGWTHMLNCETQCDKLVSFVPRRKVWQMG
jgi:hypothetical protein